MCAKWKDDPDIFNRMIGMEYAEEEMEQALAQHKYYSNRELSWLAFNERVLEESEDKSNPLLERLKFLAIFSSNLDEFFMVRVAGLQDQVRADYHKGENKSGLTPKQQLYYIAEKTQGLMKRQNAIFLRLLTELEREGVKFKKINELNEEQTTYLQALFEETIFPVLTPIAIDAYRPFPTLLGKTINLVVVLEHEVNGEKMEKLALVQVPSVLERYIQVPKDASGMENYVFLEDVIINQIDKLFLGYQVCNAQAFRLTRNADLTIHEEGARDLLVEIEKELKKRKWGTGARLEIQNGVLKQEVLTQLLDEFDIGDSDIYQIDGPLDLTFLFGWLAQITPNREHLLYESFIPQAPADLKSTENIFTKALAQDLFFHHPYESFGPIIDLMTEAANDPAVLAIKQTLYRVSGNSPIIRSLKQAAENGKQVTVLLELKARFDEENNVNWARELEQAGCLVIYGVNNLKTHSKITLIVRRRKRKIERFVHLGTGNYNDATAKIYTDMGMITSRKKFGIDATNFFNFLSGYTARPTFHHLVISPFEIREALSDLIDQEIKSHQKHGNGFIRAKMNALTDKRLMMKLYEASIAGVKVDLIIRGICCLKPRIKGVSENITVRSIVGRFLEHARVYWFHHEGENKIYLSSADMMTRNMEKRIEILFPVLEKQMRRRIEEIILLQLKDNVKARVLDETGKYHYQTKKAEEKGINSQKIFKQIAMQEIENED